jgi:CRP-like cAMP-binding protein
MGTGMPIMIKCQAPRCLQDIFYKKLVPCTLRHLRKGEFIWRAKEAHRYCYLIGSGLIKLYVVTDDGREKTLFFYTGGAVFGFQNLSNIRMTITNAVAMLPTTLHAADFSNFYELIADSREYSRAMTEYLFYHMTADVQEMVDISLSNADERLAALLVILADEYLKSERGELLIPLNNDELASMVGACRNSVYNVLSSFQKQNLIIKHRSKVEIVDLDRLRGIQKGRRQRRT